MGMEGVQSMAVSRSTASSRRSTAMYYSTTYQHYKRCCWSLWAWPTTGWRALMSRGRTCWSLWAWPTTGWRALMSRG